MQERRHSSTNFFYLQGYIAVSSLFHAPAVFLAEKVAAGIPWLESWVETRAGLNAVEKRKVSAAVVNQKLITLTSDQ
jgi:hypothetical protein